MILQGGSLFQSCGTENEYKLYTPILFRIPFHPQNHNRFITTKIKLIIRERNISYIKCTCSVCMMELRKCEHTCIFFAIFFSLSHFLTYFIIFFISPACSGRFDLLLVEHNT